MLLYSEKIRKVKLIIGSDFYQSGDHRNYRMNTTIISGHKETYRKEQTFIRTISLPGSFREFTELLPLFLI